jgi:hypothetical protein
MFKHMEKRLRLPTDPPGHGAVRNYFLRNERDREWIEVWIRHRDGTPWNSFLAKTSKGFVIVEPDEGFRPCQFDTETLAMAAFRCSNDVFNDTVAEFRRVGGSK